MIGGATWSTISIARVHRSIVCEFEMNPLNDLAEIDFGARKLEIAIKSRTFMYKQVMFIPLLSETNTIMMPSAFVGQKAIT